MKSLRFFLCFIAISVLAVSAAQGQTWVSGTGNDNNPCTRTQPCKTFAGAYAKTAAGGEIDALDPGNYGAINITHSITIDGGDNQMAVIQNGINDAAINVSAAAGETVTLRNLKLRSSSSAALGIVVNGGGYALHIEHCALSGFSIAGIFVNSSTQASGTQFYLDGTVVRDGAIGLSVGGNVSATISNSRFLGNTSFGVIVDGSGSNVAISDSEASGNIVGFDVNNASAPSSSLYLSNSIAANNQSGVYAWGAESAIILSNVFLFNNSVAGISTGSGAVVNSFKNNSNAGSGVPSGTMALQ
jgi:hypothetical protein